MSYDSENVTIIWGDICVGSGPLIVKQEIDVYHECTITEGEDEVVLHLGYTDIVVSKNEDNVDLIQKVEELLGSGKWKVIL